MTMKKPENLPGLHERLKLVAESYDLYRVNLSESACSIWADALGRIHTIDCKKAFTDHHRASRRLPTPADIIDGARAAHRYRLAMEDSSNRGEDGIKTPEQINEGNKELAKIKAMIEETANDHRH